MNGIFDAADLRLHPAMAHVPEADVGDRARLKADIEEHGQLDPIDITPEHLILDGRTRWQLLQEIGSRTVLARVVEIPEADQPGYIVRRAVNRRHLTREQRHDLIAYLASLVIEVGPEGELVGLTDAEIASATGTSRNTVVRARKTVVPNATTVSDEPMPTHVRSPNPKSGSETKLQPKAKPERPKPPPLPPRRKYPDWWRSAGLWLSHARKEDATALRELDDRVHAAMRAAGIE